MNRVFKAYYLSFCKGIAVLGPTEAPLLAQCRVGEVGAWREGQDSCGAQSTSSSLNLAVVGCFLLFVCLCLFF